MMLCVNTYRRHSRAIIGARQRYCYAGTVSGVMNSWSWLPSTTSSTRPKQWNASRTTSSIANRIRRVGSVHGDGGIKAPHVPPLPIRTALVASSVALFTPAFPAIGFVNLCLRVVMPDPQLRAAMSGLWGSVFSFAAYTLTPKLYAIGPLLWPFALCNGLTAGAAYAAIDSASGGPTGKILGNPLAGVGIGVTVAAFAPHFLYGPALSHLYGIEDASGVISSILQFPFVQSVTLATGAAAGLMIYPVLYFPINGIKGVPWAKFSLPPLLAAAAATYWVFSPGVGGEDQRSRRGRVSIFGWLAEEKAAS